MPIEPEVLMTLLTDIKESIGNLSGRLALIERDISGNGQPGLTQRVESLEGTRSRVWGAFGVLSGLAGLLEWLTHRHH